MADIPAVHGIDLWRVRIAECVAPNTLLKMTLLQPHWTL